MLHRVPAGITLVVILGAFLNLIGAINGSLPEWAVTVLDTLSTFSNVFLGIFIEAAPFLLLGTLASGFVEVFVSREDLARWIPRQTLPGVLVGGFIGLVFPVCECGVVPFVRRLFRKGVPVSVGMATLLAAPVVNPIVMASTWAAFGSGWIFWGRLGLSLFIAILTGLVFSLQDHPSDLLRENPMIIPEAQAKLFSCERESDRSQLETLDKVPAGHRIWKALTVSVDEFFEMGKYLILGALLSALMQTVVSQQALLGVASGPIFSVIVMICLAVLLSICSTVDAFIALAFTGMFSSGSILAFLVFGPMVDIKSTFMFLRVFKVRTVIYLVLIPLLLTLIVSIFMNYFLIVGS